MFETKRMRDIYSETVNFVDGMNMTSKEIFEIMYDAKEYSVSEICAIVDKLYIDGFVR